MFFFSRRLHVWQRNLSYLRKETTQDKKTKVYSIFYVDVTTDR